MKLILNYKFILTVMFVFIVPLSHAQTGNNNTDDLLDLIIPVIAAIAITQVPATPGMQANPENTKYPPRKVNPKGKSPPSSLPPYSSAVWPDCPNKVCAPY